MKQIMEEKAQNYKNGKINYVTEKAVTLIFPEDLKKSLGQMSFFNLEKEMAEIELKPHFKPC